MSPFERGRRDDRRLGREQTLLEPQDLLRMQLQKLDRFFRNVNAHILKGSLWMEIGDDEKTLATGRIEAQEGIQPMPAG